MAEKPICSSYHNSWILTLSNPELSAFQAITGIPCENWFEGIYKEIEEASEAKIATRKITIKHCQRHNGPEDWVHLAKVISQVQTQILIEFHLQNLDTTSTRNLNQTSAPPLNLKFNILTQPSFRISTKIQLHNLYKTSATKCWTSSSFKILLNFNFKILTNPCAQSLKKV